MDRLLIWILRYKKEIAAAIGLVWVFSALLLFIFVYGEKPPSCPQILPEEKRLKVLIEGDSSGKRFYGKILPYKGLEDSIMAVDGVKLPQALKIVNALRPYVDFRYLKAGERFYFVLSKDGKTVEEFVFMPDIITRHILKWDYASQKYVYRLVKLPAEIRYRILEGTIETTLNDALKKTGVSDGVRNTVNNVIECLVDVRTRARKGDRFKVLLEEKFFQGKPVPPPKVLYAAYIGKLTGKKEAFWYEEKDEKSSYNAHYSADGKALIASAFRYPLRRIHVTSTFGWRRHPVTGRRSFHNGVDYRARVGEPVFAVYTGRVVRTGYDKYGGKFIEILHPGNVRTLYLHLSRILVRKGQRVKAGELIARSGATGRVNGPHLHFAIKDPRGKWVNPLLKRMIATPKLKGKRFREFQKQVERIRKILEKVSANVSAPAA